MNVGANQHRSGTLCLANLSVRVNDTAQVQPKQLQVLVHVSLAIFTLWAENCYLLNARTGACISAVQQKPQRKGGGSERHCQG